MENNWSPPTINNQDLENSYEEGADFVVDKKNAAIDDYAYNDNNNKKGKNFSPKLILSFLFLMAIGTLAYGFYSLSSRIYQNDNLAGSEEVTLPATDNVVDELAQQKTLDTDKDGLNDYEETNIYETSPYLADTDSDGYDDKVEIERGHDPLCPTLDNCRVDWSGKTAIATSTPTSADTEKAINNNLNLEDANNEIDTSSSNTDATTSKLTAEELQALNSLTAAEVRELLISEGQVSAEELSQIDDETLMQIYKEALTKEQQ